MGSIKHTSFLHAANKKRLGCWYGPWLREEEKALALEVAFLSIILQLSKSWVASPTLLLYYYVPEGKNKPQQTTNPKPTTPKHLDKLLI